MTRGQVRRTVVVEAGILGIVGAALGIATGLIAAAALMSLAGGTLFVLDLPWGSIATAVVLGIVVAMAAAWYPARLASRLAIVAAVQHE
jgi:putative ABC transport system permease protein